MYPEILAPVGGKEQLIAAVRSGADAVYLGAKGFNARRNAENFGNDTLGDTVRYCHSHGVKVHVTVNTLVRDDEMEQLLETLDEIADSGADAVIVQDLGVMRLIRSRYPSLDIHASTQCVVHNSEGAKFFEEMGLSRVVLARELSLQEIKKIRQNTSLELEVFVHGALCMSISGGCYLSSVIGGRSGNRGLCAQPCRLDFGCGGKDHVLSLKDLSHIRYIKELADAGVCSFKVEGRMKRPEYVAAAVTACKKALRGEAYDADTLRAVFSRSGFTDGYFRGVRDKQMFGYRGKEDVAAAKGVLDTLQQLYHRENPLLGVTMQLHITREQARLQARCGDTSVTAVGEGGIPAEKRPTDRQQAEKFLTKS
ncbi:MAG: U32 family peptidase, partial [Oscillospiraceae bacterium]|nr:U32 family peptidase [Oscillospiraceae bacterium]